MLNNKALFLLSPVSFLEFPQNQSVFLNESVVLRCAIKDIRTVLFFFSFNNEPVHSGSGIHVTYSERGITVMFEATEMFNNSRWRCVFCSTTCPPYFCSESALIKIQGKMFRLMIHLSHNLSDQINYCCKELATKHISDPIYISVYK